jgi:protein-S-isoprenylcysteine O-methyltransferase Ste14
MQLLYGIPTLIPAYLILNALYVFARDGGGTGFPYDPPKRLVTTGVYAHLSNPMQLGICLLMAWWGVMVECVYVSLTSLVALMLFTVFKQICNGSSQVGKTDPRWATYQRTTPKWLPRLTHSNK